jgi:hypothetical protein
VHSATYFSFVSSATYVVAFIGPSLASFTMSQNLWLPFYVNITLLFLAIPTINMLPHQGAVHQQIETLSASSEAGEGNPLLGEQTPSRFSNAFECPSSPLRKVVHVIRRLTNLVIGRREFQILLVSFFLTSLASSDTKLLVQYISKRYNWTFARVSMRSRTSLSLC